MHLLCPLSTLFLQLLLTLSTIVLPPSDVGNATSIGSLDTTNHSSNLLAGSNSLPSSTSLVLDFFGPQIPSSAVNAAFGGAVTKIQPFLQNQPNSPITNDNFQYRATGGSVQIGVIAVLHHRISWLQLDTVLRQASSFMNGDVGTRRQHMQELFIEIIKDGTKIGEGLVSYHPPRGLQSRHPAPANPTIANDTKLLLVPMDPSLNGPTDPTIPYPIPDTPFTLLFNFLGEAIPMAPVWAAFKGAYSQLEDNLDKHPAAHIPSNRFYHYEEGVGITVHADRGGILMTWTQLSWVLGGLYSFMTGTPEHYQLIACDIALAGHGDVGTASVWYYSLGREVTK